MEQNNAWRFPLAMTIFVMVVVLVLATGSGSMNLATWADIRDRVQLFASNVAYYVGPWVLVAVLIRTRFLGRRSVYLLLAGLAINALALTVRAFWRGREAAGSEPVDQVIAAVIIVTEPGMLASLALLFSVRFRAGLESVRYAGITLIPAMMAARLLVHWVPTQRYSVYIMTAWLVYLVTLALVVGCAAFRRVPYPPPVEGAREVSLKCPRCTASIQIASGHGECPHCRMQISIAFDEGVCAKCQYPLHGVSGDACPGCGEPIVKPPANPA